MHEYEFANAFCIVMLGALLSTHNGFCDPPVWYARSCYLKVPNQLNFGSGAADNMVCSAFRIDENEAMKCTAVLRGLFHLDHQAINDPEKSTKLPALF